MPPMAVPAADTPDILRKPLRETATADNPHPELRTPYQESPNQASLNRHAMQSYRDAFCSRRGSGTVALVVAVSAGEGEVRLRIVGRILAGVDHAGPQGQAAQQHAQRAEAG